MLKLGLIGKSLKHSYSPNYFQQKFRELNLTDVEYNLYELDKISRLQNLLEQDQEIGGFSVTVPYKSAILPYLTITDCEAQTIGAVNTVKVVRHGSRITLKGYNTDTYGFEQTLKNHDISAPSALIFGNGGAAQAVKYVLDNRQIPYQIVSRRSNSLNYNTLTQKIIRTAPLLINTTPVGMYPYIEDALSIPLDGITAHHTLIDLIYNPDKTTFLQMGDAVGAKTINGLEMLHAQADKSLAIFLQL
ncbi:MAG: shikimate dehydrogenase [Salinivirgaceae bacterium]|jgi:shikimate dehydrogenase|nr:shikimate dehydrogenase [Salinivirgaceae bacterium]